MLQQGYYAQGGFLRVIRDLHGVSSSSADIYDISNAICRKIQRFIKWPNEEEIVRSKLNFYDYTNGFPFILGRVDGTHIPMNAPFTPFNETALVNRKSYHSINV